MINVCNPRNPVKDYINTTSRSTNWSKDLSPFFLGPVNLYGNYKSLNVENGWQYCKCYSEYDDNGKPSKNYFKWAINGWNNLRAVRYPMGKGVKPLYSWWNGEKLNYIEARKKIYCPIYAQAVEKSEAYQILIQEYKNKGVLWLWDFDGYDFRSLGMNYKDVLNDPNRKMGHAFVLAMMLENQRAWEND